MADVHRATADDFPHPYLPTKESVSPLHRSTEISATACIFAMFWRNDPSLRLKMYRQVFYT
jgi:hypothetical protein